MHTQTHTLLFTSQRCSLMDWSHVDHCDVLISYLDSHSHGTHLLCWRSIGEQVMLNFFKSVTIKKYTSTSWVAWGWVHFSFYFVSFWGNVLNGIVDFTWYSDCYYHYPIKLFPPKLKCSNGGSIVCPECISTVEIFNRFVSCLLVCDPKVLVKPPPCPGPIYSASSFLHIKAFTAAVHVILYIFLLSNRTTTPWGWTHLNAVFIPHALFLWKDTFFYAFSKYSFL